MTERAQTPATEPANARKGLITRWWIHASGAALIVAAVAALAYESGFIPGRQPSPQKAGHMTDGLFQPPTDDQIPNDQFGAAIRRGQSIFTNTSTNASHYVGNGLSCSNCHLGAGRQPLSAPMWGAWGQYPRYRAKNNQINTMEDRVMGCFTFSMNAQDSVAGGPPPHGDDIYRDLQSYFYWLATGAPNNELLKGAGFGKVAKTELGYSPERGATVFAANCAVCHGGEGQGQKDRNGRYVFPPLWGQNSYNWGAGMARIDTAAAFIKNNMPLSQPGRLSDQDAWDVAAYINSFERPKDARQKNHTIEETRKLYHEGDQIYYGREVNGVLLGVGSPEPARPFGSPD